MPKYPRIYAESTINRMYKKLDMPDETVGLLHRYFQAMSNFYELIPLRKVYEIINTQTGGNLPEEKFIAFSEIARHEEHFYYILGLEELYRDEPKSEPMDRLLVNESLPDVDMQYFYDLDKAKYRLGDDYYVPGQNVLLKYADEMYYEDNVYVRSIRDFMKKDAKLTRSETEDFLGWLRFESSQPDFSIDSITELLEEYSLDMTVKQYERFFAMWNDFHNNFRAPVNNGYTPIELHKKYGGGAPKSISLGPNITQAIKSGDTEMINAAKGMLDLAVLAPESRKLIEDALPKAQPALKIKVGRNDPCPCGSGKKYKKCCGR